jgi:hypothetical protein
MIRCFLAAALLALATISARAAHPDCNVLFPCEGVQDGLRATPPPALRARPPAGEVLQRDERRAAVVALVTLAAAEAGVPGAIAHRLIRLESNYQPHLRGRAGEWGLGQIKCQTARGVGFRGSCGRLADPAENLRWAFAYLRLALARGGGRLRRRVALPARRLRPSPLHRLWQEGAGAMRLHPDERRVLRLMLIVAAVIALGGVAFARDDGRYAQTDPELKKWFDKLSSKRGPCCSDADGFALSDVDWESKGGRFRVRLEGEWHDVPADALITEPNRVGRTMVWPIKYPDHIHIRCFMPGAMG